MPIPRHALFLTLAGMLPFIAGAALRLSPEPDLAAGQYALVYPSDAIAILAAYGVVILCFMSGVLWGLAAAPAQKSGPLPYILSVLPALGVFFLATSHLLGAPSNTDALFWLMLGFPAVFLIDMHFARIGLAPAWWLKLRLPPTLVATAACAIGWAV